MAICGDPELFSRIIISLIFNSHSIFLFAPITTVVPSPQNVTAIATSSTSVNVTWLPVSRFNNTQYNLYTFKWVAVTQGTLNRGVVSGTSYSIQGLTPFTTYSIRVAAKEWNLTNEVRLFSKEVWVQTLEGGK